CAEFRRNQVTLVADVGEAGAGCDRELLGIAEPVVVEVADSVHLEVRDERIPIRDGAPAGVGMEIDPVETERGGDERRRRLSVGTEAFSVEEELCVELARVPGREGRLGGSTCG